MYLHKFCVTVATFNFIWLKAKDAPELDKATTHLRDVIPPKERLATTVQWLAKGLTFDDLADQCGTGKSTAVGASWSHHKSALIPLIPKT
jgi:hypothetical protein